MRSLPKFGLMHGEDRTYSYGATKPHNAPRGAAGAQPEPSGGAEPEMNAACTEAPGNKKESRGRTMFATLAEIV